MFAKRFWIAGLVAAGTIAVAVFAATDRQRSTAETNFKEAQAAAQMQVAMLSQERGLDRFLADERPSSLQVLYQARVQLTTGLAHARALSGDDPLELKAVARQAAAFRSWDALASAAISRRQQAGAVDSAALERQRSTIIDRFLTANDEYQSRLLINRDREERSAALFPVWILLGLGALFGAIAAAVGWRQRNLRLGREALAAGQARFAESIQFAASEDEAHQLVTGHLETSIPGSSVLVLNRNNSLDRLDPSPPLRPGHPLAEQLAASQPRSCLAVRLSRRYDRGGETDAEALNCAICGALDGPSSCQPLLVGGEVIGSVLVSHPRQLSSDSENGLHNTVSQAAPVLANLRNLAVAERRALTDTLTGLPNRRAIDDTLRQMVAHAARADAPFSIALLDLDRFKQINDTYGHDRGDDALAALSALLRSELRGGDFAGRNGGEEFVLFLPDTDQPGAFTLAEKVRENIRTLAVNGIECTISASIGIAVYPEDGTTPGELMRVADRNLYTAKRHGRDRTETTTSRTTLPMQPIAAAGPD